MNNRTASCQVCTMNFTQPYADSTVQWDNGETGRWEPQYIENILYLCLPIFVAFAMPILLPLFIYGITVFLHIYELRNKDAQKAEGDYLAPFFDDARKSVATFLDSVASFWNGYEIKGLENLPSEGPALLVSYHGTSPLDLWYFMGKGMLAKKRLIRCVGDQFCFKMPGWGNASQLMGITPGTIDDCIRTLKEGNLLIIAPGGVREALFSDESYKILWERRLGFAKIAKETSVPVIPIFTENSREIFRTPKFGQCEPINFSQSTTPEEIKHVVEKKLKKLIKQHQVLPGSIFKGVIQRLRNKSTKEDEDLATEWVN